MASAFFFERRSLASSSLASGRPMRTAFVRAQVRCPGLRPTCALSRATSTPGAEYRKSWLCGRSTRTRR